MIIINLDFTNLTHAKKIVNVVNYWYRRADSLIEFSEKLKNIRDEYE